MLPCILQVTIIRSSARTRKPGAAFYTLAGGATLTSAAWRFRNRKRCSMNYGLTPPRKDSYGTAYGWLAISCCGITAVQCTGVIRLMPARVGSCIERRSKATRVQPRDEKRRRSILDGRLILIRQREYVNRVVALWIDSGLREEVRSDCPQSGHHRNILLSIHAIRNGAILNRPSKRRFPENLSCIGIESAEFLIEVPPENHVSRRHQRRAVTRGATFVNPLNLAGGHIDLGDSTEFFRIGSGPANTGSAFGLVAIRASHIKAIIDIRNIKRILAGVIRHGPVTFCVVRANDVLLAGLLEHDIPVDGRLPTLDVDV